MLRAARISCWFGLLLGLALVGESGVPDAGVAAEAVDGSLDAAFVRFNTQIQPVLKKYCIDCHGGKKTEADLSLNAFKDAASLQASVKVWEKMSDKLHAGEMPPEDAPQPSTDELKRLKAFVADQLGSCGQTVDPAHVTIHRLNRNEYNNTIRDLVGVDFKPADDFPSDDVGEGFDNIGDVLSLPPLLLEKYLAASEKIMTTAILDEPVRHPVTHFAANKLVGTVPGGLAGNQFRRLASNGEVHVTFNFPKTGQYILRARAYGEQAGPDPAQMMLRLEGKDVKTFDVKAVEDAPGVYEVQVDVEAGKKQLAAAFINDYYMPDDPDPKNRDRNLAIEFLEIEGPADVDARQFPASHKRIIFCQPTDATRDDCAKQIIQRFATRAYRRPVTDDEVARLLHFVELAHRNGDSFERGIQLALEAVLVSPHFLFRVELDPAGEKPGATRQLNDYQLATRLSYFLWSTMPDDTLFDLAAKGELRKGDNLHQQVARMLHDPKSRALVENFGGQWLQTRNLVNASPDPNLFPTWDEGLRTSMLKETELFFDSIMREDRSIMDFIDADYTFVNGRLAKHYGISGVRGAEFQRVKLDGPQRGGVLTQASILTITSNPTRTSPVKRGKWVLENLLGAPSPPPPPGVPELSEDKKVVLTGTLRKRMEEHRANPNCASCHSRLDPLGFGLENFNAIGGWRTEDGSFPVDASGTLPGGKSFTGPSELRAILKSNKNAFARCLTEKMLVYALGRGLTRGDRCDVDSIVEQLTKDDYRFSSLVLGIVDSPLFQMRGGKSR